MHKVRQLTKKMMRCITEINVEVTKEDEICEAGNVQVFQTCIQASMSSEDKFGGQ